MKNTHHQRGVTIVEGLVALVILSVGMLGIASLYVASLKTGRTALTRTNAVNLVNDLIDSMRANGLARTSYNLATRTTPPAMQNCGADGVCTRDQLAENDLANWLTSVNSTLPDGTGTVSVTSPMGLDVYAVGVSWIEPGETERYTYQASVEMLPVTP